METMKKFKNKIENSNIDLCPYCFTGTKKLIKCSKCNEKFCIKCLTEVDKNIIFCHECLADFVKNEVSFIIVKSK